MINAASKHADLGTEPIHSHVHSRSRQTLGGFFNGNLKAEPAVSSEQWFLY